MDNLIEMAKEMGEAIQMDQRFIRTQMAQAAADEDEALQGMIGEFNLIRLSMDQALSAENQDEEKIMKCNNDMRELYTRIMQNPAMVAYNEAKIQMDELMKSVNDILELCVNGADPATAEPQPANCTHDCSTCGGCH
jgi:cell fate (sporulation/competence/biofilm development) regulator YlbF (YheA/YmcA/DUF963 family)